MAYGKTLEEIKAMRIAEESGLHKNSNKMIMADMPQLEKPVKKTVRKRVAKKPKK